MTRAQRVGCLGRIIRLGIAGIALLAALLVLVTLNGPPKHREESPPTPPPKVAEVAPAAEEPDPIPADIRRFFGTYSRLGTPDAVEEMPDWAKGKRRGVTTREGRQLLLYYNEAGYIMTVYDTTPGSPREILWGEPEGESAAPKARAGRPRGRRSR